MFKKTEYQGYDVKAIEKFYNSNFKQLKKRGKSDEEAHEGAKFFVDYYLHTFRAYA